MRATRPAAVVASLGYALGSEWQRVSHGMSILGYALFALVVVVIVGFIAYRWRQYRRAGHLRGDGRWRA